MRDDICGLFWDDTPPPKILKPVPPPKQPPARTWEEPGYLPGLEEALAMPCRLFTPAELEAARVAGEPLVMDSEVYRNFFIVCFCSYATGKVIYFQMSETEVPDLNLLRWILENFLTIGFNSGPFDLTILALLLAGFSCAQLKKASDDMIVMQLKHWLLLRQHKVKALKVNHVDIIDVCPLKASLKLYGGRVHVPKMQDLPFNADITLDLNQQAITRWYCINDLVTTAFVFKEVAPAVELRAQMSAMYGLDLRSKSDSQVAEAVMIHELTRKNYGHRPSAPKIEPGTSFKYAMPPFVQFQRPELIQLQNDIAEADFVLDESGYTNLPETLEKRTIELGWGTYRLGIGGLHSSETKITYRSDSSHQIVDRDVASYYPAICLNLGLFPDHLGPDFLTIYRSLVERRLQAKKEGNKVVANSLKISVNGIFGKTGNSYSLLYAPRMVMQITITGQLSLLMLIEQMEAAGIPIVSANTDGIIMSCPRDLLATMEATAKAWEVQTGFVTEETRYRSLHCRDVNNYIAVKEKGGVKVRGEYSERGSAGDSVLSKNPSSLICNDAVCAFLESGTPIRETILSCHDLRRFISIRHVKGGAVKDGQYLGRAIRWYYAKEILGTILYASNGHDVPLSLGAKPCMQLPALFPNDIDYERYIKDAETILDDVGFNG